MIGIQDAAGNHWYYAYDSLGRKTVAADPDLGTWTYQYDNADRLTQVTDALGQATCYTHDALGRTTTKIALYGSGHGVTTAVTDPGVVQPRRFDRNVDHCLQALSDPRITVTVH